MWKEVKTLKLKSVFVVALIMIIIPAMMRTFAYSAKSVCLFDMKTKEVIYGYNEDVPMEPASITKIVTAITALSLGDEDEVITVDEKSAGSFCILNDPHDTRSTRHSLQCAHHFFSHL